MPLQDACILASEAQAPAQNCAMSVEEVLSVPSTLNAIILEFGSFLEARESFIAPPHVGEWLSLVEHLVRDQGVGGSNPLSPTN